MSKFKVWIIIILGVVVLAGCQSRATVEADVPTVAEDVPRIMPQELQSLLDAGERVVIVDTRSLDAFQASHIAGAGSIPYAEIETRHQELPKGLKIVLYCT